MTTLPWFLDDIKDKNIIEEDDVNNYTIVVENV